MGHQQTRKRSHDSKHHCNHDPGAYSIISLLCARGMGQVYLAEDTRLSRKLAMKVLPAEFASDLEQIRRFVQEPARLRTVARQHRAYL